MPRAYSHSVGHAIKPGCAGDEDEDEEGGRQLKPSLITGEAEAEEAEGKAGVERRRSGRTGRKNRVCSHERDGSDESGRSTPYARAHADWHPVQM